MFKHFDVFKTSRQNNVKPPSLFFSTAPDFCSRQPETLPRSFRERKKIPSVPKFFFRGDAFTHFFAEELILGQKLERTRKKSLTEWKAAFLKKVSPFEILKKDGWQNLKKLFLKNLGFMHFYPICRRVRNFEIGNGFHHHRVTQGKHFTFY